MLAKTALKKVAVGDEDQIHQMEGFSKYDLFNIFWFHLSDT
jgi:hypothetical protein